QAALPSSNDGMLDVFYQTSDGISHDSLFQVHALVSAGEVMALLSEQKVDLGADRLCTDRDTSIVVSNPGCPDMTVKGVSLSGKYFYLKNTRLAPFTLRTGESQTISFVFSPGAAGSQNGLLQVETDADKNPVHTVPLSA